MDRPRLAPDDDIPRSELLKIELRRFEKHQLEMKDEYGADLLSIAIKRILYLEEYFMEYLDGNMALMKLFEATRKEIDEQRRSRVIASLDQDIGEQDGL